MTATLSKTNMKPKKGDTILLTGIWSDDGSERTGGVPAIYVRRVVVQSWGKQQATFTDAETGCFIKVRGYTQHVQFGYTEADIAEHLQTLRENIKTHLLKAIKIEEDWLEKYGKTSRPSIVQDVRDRLAATVAKLDMEFLVRDYNAYVRDSKAFFGSK